MPIYKYTHTCGFEQRFFLEQDVNSKIISCYRCGKQVTAYQVRDDSEYVGEADGVKGVLQRGKKTD